MTSFWLITRSIVCTAMEIPFSEDMRVTCWAAVAVAPLFLVEVCSEAPRKQIASLLY